ncbi:MAG: radical SAM protein [Candidatus Glassbacteria bacterium]|nr:radical SAM protein [Candidatus Glassbacteria bacterium]
MTPDWPEFIQLETTIHCNSHCDFCQQRLVARRPGFMDERLVHKIIDESAGHGITYRPFLQNEPLMDKRMADIVSYIRRDKTAKVELNTNGGLMTPETSEKLLDAGLDMVRFSIDGFSKEVAEIIRPIDYGCVLENTRTFIELAARAGHPCQVEVRMIDTELNRHQQADYLEFWSGLGAEAKVVPLYNWPWSGQTGYVPAPCPKILREMFFVVDGRAVLCCWDSQARAVIGDINHTPLQEIWTGELNRKYRRLLSQGRRGEIFLCSRCDGFKHLLEESSAVETGGG